MAEKLMWETIACTGETPRDAARQFAAVIAQSGESELPVRFVGGEGVFTFHNAAWMYRVAGPINGRWKVYRTGEPSKAGKAYQRARRLQRPKAGES